MKQLPAILSITELAMLLGLPRHVIRNHVEAGRIPFFYLGKKRQISMAALRRDFPELWEAVLLKAEVYDAAVFADGEDTE